MELLLFLQNLRHGCPDWIITAIVIISESTIIISPLLAACTFWSLDKKKGTYMLCALVLATFLNEFLKVTFCIYRPWILDSRLVPVSQVLGTATNYSFPSSHSCGTVAALTSVAIVFPGKKSRNIIFVIIALLVMFSRMFLGFHTIKDVCCGAMIGFATPFLMKFILSDTFDLDRFCKLALPVSLGITAITIIYILFKSYPLDYGADGLLLVDPTIMRRDTFGILGVVTGVGVGLFLENRFISSIKPNTKMEAVIRCLTGIAIFALLYAVILKIVLGGIDPGISKYIRFVVCGVFVTAGNPLIFKCIKFKKIEK